MYLAFFIFFTIFEGFSLRVQKVLRILQYVRYKLKKYLPIGKTPFTVGNMIHASKDQSIFNNSCRVHAGRKNASQTYTLIVKLIPILLRSQSIITVRFTRIYIA